MLALIGYEQDTTLFKWPACSWKALPGAGLRPRDDGASVPEVYVAGTSVGGTQNNAGVFIENCHVHVDRIVAALTGTKVNEPKAQFEEPEN